MNNKGFAITSILYTLFVLFSMILLSVLSALSYKRGVLEKTIIKLEEKYDLEEIELANSYTKTAPQTDVIANINGKYIFKLKYTIEGEEYIQNCSIYLKKGDIIPSNNDPSLGDLNPAKNFTLIPNDCNNYTYSISVEDTSLVENKLFLTEVYKYKGEY